MSDTSKVNSKPSKSKRGGARPGAGRPLGRLSASTRAREKRVKKEVAAVLAALAPEKLDELCDDPLEALRFALRCHLGAGDLAGIASVAERMLPYCRPKLSSETALVPLPSDLLPDAPAEPDLDDVPDHIIDPGVRPLPDADGG